MSLRGVLATTAACAMAAVVSLHPATARADGDVKATAQLLFEQGQALVERGSFADACPKFAESLRLDPGLGVKLWLADCYENAGQIASAWVQFKEAAAAAAMRHDPREAVARARAAALEDRLPRLVVLVPGEAALAGIVVRRDGVVVGPASWGLGAPLDPGVHTVSATAPGRARWSTSVEVRAGTKPLLVTIPVLAATDGDDSTSDAEATSQADAGAGDASAGSVHRDETRRSRSTGAPQRIAGISIAGLGLVGLALGTYFSLNAKSTYDSSNDGHCLPDNECDPTGKKDRSDASSMAAAATVAMGLGAAALVGGAVLYFTAPRAARVSVAAAPSPRGGGLRLVVAF